MKFKFVTALMALLSSSFLLAQEVIPLYQGSIPNSRSSNIKEKSSLTNDKKLIIEQITVPTLEIYLPPAKIANGAAILICPGGGYWVNAYSHEGTDVAKKFNEAGVAAFVVKYRIPNSLAQPDPSIAPLQDAQKAIILIRTNAKKWKVDPDRVGVMGFSAGGHLASTLGTHYEKVLVDNPANVKVRPDFMALMYPVISSDTTFAHLGSFEQLLGKNAGEDKRKEYSNELQVNANTPPTFLMHATDDDVVPVKNSIVFYEALVKNKVPAELHIYEKGGHGFGMFLPDSKKELWMDRVINWMSARKLLDKK